MLEDKINDYIGWKTSRGQKSAYIYGGHLRQFLAFTGNRPLGELTVKDLTAFRFFLQKNNKDTYVNYKMGVIRHFLRFCKENNVKCPSTFLIPYERAVSTQHHAITDKEHKRMLAVVPGRNFEELKKRLVLMLLNDTGIRVSELCDLNLDDIDNPGRMAKIMSKKTKKYYWIGWSRKTKKVMDQYLGIRLCINNYPEVLIASKTHRRPTTRAVERWVKNIANEAGIINKIVPHGYRHRKAHDALDKGATLYEINQLLGHSENNLNSALPYIRLNKKQSQTVVKKFVRG